MIDDYSAAMAFLFDRINYERTSHIPYRTSEFKLDRMRELMRLLGHPERQLPVIHVAGTKGKGSTASMIAAVLTQAGYKTGLYTSPHLQHIEERYVIDHQQIAPADLMRLVQAVEPVVQALDHSRGDESLRGPTFFEITTALAFRYFQEQRVQAAVFEVGLGGRLDSTNVCQPVACAITSISFDHVKQLGNTLAAIAREKAGIIKPQVPVVSGVLPSEPREVIRHIAGEQQAPLLQCGQDYHITYCDNLHSPNYGAIDYHESTATGTRTLSHLTTNLRGEHQAANVGTAVATLGILQRQGWNIPESAIRTGLTQVRCPARIELVRQEPPVILDTAHNAASIDALCRELEQAFGYHSKTLIFATSRDKESKDMLVRLLPLFQDVILTRYVNNPRARSVEELAHIANEVLATMASPTHPNVHLAAAPLAAWELANRWPAPRLTCITGSFFLAAELRDVVLQSAK